MAPKFVGTMCRLNITHILACTAYSGFLFLSVNVCVEIQIGFPCSVRARVISLH
jgi:hypothetical protein